MPNETKDTYITGEKSLTSDQAQRLVEHTSEMYDETLLRVALGTGMRRGDLVSIKWNNIDMDERRIRYYENKKDSNHKVFIRPKLEKSLERWESVQSTKYGGLPKHVFPAKRGDAQRDHVSPKYAYDTLQRVANDAGIIDVERVGQKWEGETLPIHALRATYVKRELDRLEQRFNSRSKAVDFVAKQINDKPSTVREHYAVPSEYELKAAFDT